MEDKLLRKIEKLLNLGNGTNFSGEAETALKRAYDLMQENGLTMEDISKVSRDEKLGELGKTKVSEEEKQWRKWELQLVNSIAKLFDCQILRTTHNCAWDKKAELNIIGRESNRITTKLMFEWIHDKTKKEAKYLDPYHQSSRTAYCFGVANAIRKKVDTIKAEAPKTDAWGIVPVDEVSQWLKDNIENLKDHKLTPTQIRDAMAYEYGRSEGDKVSLNRQFGLVGIESKVAE